MVAIIDYGLGNLGSICNMISKIGLTQAIITRNAQQIQEADKLILPGVGSFDAGMIKIHESGLTSVLNEEVLVKKKPVLGICLGMQLLTNSSAEGNEKGLGWIDASTHKFSFDTAQKMKIPHMGWNEVSINKQHELVNNLPQPSRFYFVHSYYVQCNNPHDALLTCHYGIDFTCAVQHENIMGVQFHAEKSHRFGMQLLKNFIEL